MYYYEIGSKEYSKLLTHVYKTVELDIEKIKIYKKLISELSFYEGKVINIRIEKIIKKILEPYYNVHYYKYYDWYRLCIYNKKSTRFEIILGKDEKESKRTKFKLVVLQNNLESLEKKNKKDKENSSKVLDIVSQYNAALRYFKIAKSLLDDIPGWYSFDRFN